MYGGRNRLGLDTYLYIFGPKYSLASVPVKMRLVLSEA